VLTEAIVSSNSAIASGDLSAYQGAEIDDKQRKSPRIRQIKSTDRLLPKDKRKNLQLNTQDLQRNFPIAAWAIRRHLDYVSCFNFQAKNKDAGLNRDIEALMSWYSRPANCDVAGRHSLRAQTRINEALRVVDGDMATVTYQTGHLQGIESDRIRDPDKIRKDDDRELGNWVQGFDTDRRGRLRRMAVHRRSKSGKYEFDGYVQAKDFFHLGYFERYDQVRGISPLASALSTFRDVSENFAYALAKTKIAQLFGLVFYSDSPEEVGNSSVESEDEDGDGTPEDRYEVKLNDGPFKLELDERDRAEFLESKSPAIEFQSFNHAMIAAALKSVDIPFSFYDESFTNFFGSRAALMHYIRSTAWKQESLQRHLNSITEFRLVRFIVDRVLRLPRGMQFSDLRWEWVATGVPWWDPLKEIQADMLAVGAGFKSRGMVIKERTGREFRDVVDELADEEAYMIDKGVHVDIPAVLAANKIEENSDDKDARSTEE